MDNATYLKWSWVYGSSHVEEFASLDDAVADAEAASNEGSESFWLIEEIGVGVVDPEVVGRMRQKISERNHQEWLSEPKATHMIELRALEKSAGKDVWANIEPVYSGDPEQALTAAQQRYGADRVRVRKIR